MDSLINFIKKVRFSRFWVKAWLVFVGISIIGNHLTQPEYFPLDDSYRFPLVPISVSILLISLFMAIGEINFQYFKRKYFKEKINTRNLLRFVFSTIGYDTIAYVILFYSINGVHAFNLYELLVGLSVTLLICFIGVIVVYAKDIYKLYRFTFIEGKLKIVYSGKIKLVNYDEIAFAHSENKIVFVVKTDGSSIPTDFTLNEIEEKINEQSFYRANRQIILHASAIKEVQSIENGKLTVTLKPSLSGNRTHELTISRYKKQDFINWFEKKS